MAASGVETTGSVAHAPGRIDIDFLYLDRETCSRCAGSEANLDAALDDVSRILASAGIVPSVNRTLVASAEQARALGFVSSPTIRVNGRDIALHLRESACGDCGALAGNDAIDCRVWVWQDAEYEEVPAAMVVDAVLRQVYAESPRPAPAAGPAVAADVPENLQRFFAGVALPQASGCCSASEQQSCCEPAAKASCCGEASTSGGGCGCR